MKRLKRLLALGFIALLIFSLGACGSGNSGDADENPSGHECNFVQVQDREPTCTSKGVVTYACTICRDSYSEEYGEPSHAIVEASCQNPSYCEMCNEQFGEALECQVDEWTITEEATCQNGSYRYGFCIYCSEQIYEEIAKVDHDFSSLCGETSATCSSNAFITYYCAYNCGEEYTVEQEGTKLDHSFTDSACYPEVIDATCTENKKEIHYCDYCYTEEKVIECENTALGHDEQTHEGRKNSCDIYGWNEYVTCSRCDYTTYSVIDALSHNYVDGRCENCNYYQPSEGIEYRKEYSDEHGCEVAYVTSFDACTDERVVVALSYEGAPVVGIDGLAAKLVDNTSIPMVNLILPPYLEFLSALSFYKCDYLESVTFTSSVRFEYAPSDNGTEVPPFMLCPKLASIYVPDETTWCNMEIDEIIVYTKSYWGGYEIGYIDLYIDDEQILDFILPESITVIKDNAFRCTNINSIELHENIKTIGAYAFAGTKISSIALQNVEEIGEYAFKDSAIKEVSIPGSIEKIVDYAFFGCPELIDVTINEGVKEIGKYAFSVSYRGASKLERVTFPAGLETIDDYAFKYCDAIVELVFLDNLKTIGREAFYECMSIEKICIPNSLETIAKDAFYYCSDLKYVYIEDLESWCKIDFGDNSLMANTLAVLYVDGEILRDLIIPESITEIKQYTFANLSQLDSIVIHDRVTTIGTGAFIECFGYREGEEYYSGVKSVIIGNGVVQIKDRAFAYCKSLITIEFGSSLTSIGKQAFAELNSLETIYIPENVTEIKKNAFTGEYMTDLVIYCAVDTLPSGWDEAWTNAETITFGYDVIQTND